MRARSAFALLLASTAALGACADEATNAPPGLASQDQHVVYGDDDRLDFYEVADADLQSLMRDSIVALVRPRDIDVSDPSNIVPDGTTLQTSRGLCPDERFLDHPTAANCSGTLIDDDLVLTAGHCVDSQADCENYYFVFDYFYAADGVLETITSDDVYTCNSIAARRNSGNLDYAIIQLDRPVTGRAPAAVRAEDTALSVGDPLVMIGFGSGIPAKADSGGNVVDSRSSTLDYFQATVDAFGGNSGSGVFTEDLSVTGILVRGATDYVFDRAAGCTRVNVLGEDTSNGEDITYVARALEELCDVNEWPSARLCGVSTGCGDGTLDPGEECDDGNGASGDGCSFDCRDEFCGDGTLQPGLGEECDDGNTTALDGCSDTCIVEFVCGDGTLQPGEACDDGNTDSFDGCSASCVVEECPAAVVTSTGVDVVAGDSCTFGNVDASASCGGSNTGGDVAVAFTAPAAGTYAFDTTVSGQTNYDTVVYLRDGCFGEELACNDDAVQRRSRVTRTLAAGETVVVYVSGYNSECGQFGLSILEPTCGDGFVEGAEVCDDGNTDDGDACPSDCGTATTCGNGVVDDGEACDDGNTNDDDNCTSECQWAGCLDGEVTELAPVSGNSCGPDTDGEASCGNGTSGGEAAFLFVAPEDGVFGFTTDNAGTDYDTAIYARSGCGGEELGCNDDIVFGDILVSALELELSAGQEIVVYVSGYDTECGNFELSVYRPVCGDGVPQGLEECDDGNDVDTDACTSACTLAACGDGFLQEGEQCDDGNLTSFDGCDDSCNDEVCGDGILQPALGEQCDDGNNENTDGCDAFCQFEGVCGDGVLDAAEQCDDGNAAINDGCDDLCRLETCFDRVLTTIGDDVVTFDTCAAGDNDGPASCGRGTFGGDPAFVFEAPAAGRYAFTTLSDTTDYDTAIYARERCGGAELACNDDIDFPDFPESRIELDLDAGERIVVHVSGYQDSCGTAAVSVLEVGCGDGIVQDGEACDDGNNESNDGCTAECVLETCGDGEVQDGIGEACDDGNTESNDGCSATCQVEECGDGVLQAPLGEQCDDGNSDSEDGCSDACLLEFCGDGVLQRALGEQCDDGNTVPDDGCSRSCAIEFCGDGTVQPGLGETCDDGNTRGGDGCSAACQPEVCGDGIVQDGEACDDGNTSSGDGCTDACVLEFCGDGVVQDALGETCDDGASNSDSAADACRTNCALAGCGDGVVDTGEACDDGAGNGMTADACRMTCQLPVCGDGVVDSGEECDDGLANSDTDADACRTDCVLPVCGDGVTDDGELCDDGDDNDDVIADACRTTCEPAFCGDGVLDSGEGCDDGDDNDDTAPGACRTSCMLASCGDGVVDDGEECDDGELNSDDDADACRSMCLLPSCGDGVVDGDEACDDGNLNSDTDADACRTTCDLAFCGDGIVDEGEECDDGDDNEDAPGACGLDCSLVPDVADPGADAGSDAGSDAGTDAGGDAGSDAGTDAGGDAGTDVGSDAGNDVGGDAGTDVGSDAGNDAGTDAGSADATPDRDLGGIDGLEGDGSPSNPDEIEDEREGNGSGCAAAPGAAGGAWLWIVALIAVRKRRRVVTMT